MARIDPAKYGQNLNTFLDLIAYSEGTSTVAGSDDGYNVLVGGGLFHDYSEHPLLPPGLYLPTLKLHSTGAGRYQLLHRYFLSYSSLLGLHDFSPASQDSIAVQQIKERAALGPIQAGRIEDAIYACSNIWASFPGNHYGQHQHRLDILMNKWDSLQKNRLPISQQP